MSGNGWLTSPMIEEIGWVLVHFIWQGALIAGIYAFLQRLLIHSSANLRYITGCVCLLIMLACPVLSATKIIFAAKDTPVSSALDGLLFNERYGGFGEETPGDSNTTIADKPVSTQNASSPINLSLSFLQPYLPWLVLLWFAGVAALSFRLLGNWISLKYVCGHYTRPVSEHYEILCRTLAERMGIHRYIRCFESARIDAPSTIGWIKPIILLPTSAITGLSPEQMETILAHELAHIRRFDYIVNLIQSVIETLLFYHPAVWWISRQVRIEREHCCDDQAVQLGGDLVTYIHALSEMEKIRQKQFQFALSSQGGFLLQRIKRLAGIRTKTGKLTSSSLSGLVTMSIVMCIFLLTNVEESHAQGFWQEVNIDGPKPEPRVGHSMVYDPIREVVLLHSGDNYVTTYNDTWAWDGEKWEKISESGPARIGTSMVYDEKNQEILLFGGTWRITSGFDYSNDLWKWNGAEWSKIELSADAPKPSPRNEHAMVYDKQNQRILLLGGVSDAPNPYDDTWEWDGEKWTELAIKNPSIYTWSNGFIDPVSNSFVVVFANNINDWKFSLKELKNNSWITIYENTEMDFYMYTKNANDVDRNIIVLFGGGYPWWGSFLPPHLIPRMDTTTDRMMEWDGRNMRILDIERPPSRNDHAMVYDQARKNIVLFGGVQNETATNGTGEGYLNDTWIYTASSSSGLSSDLWSMFSK